MPRRKRFEYDHVDYLCFLLPTPELAKTVKIVARRLKQSKVEFDAIAFRGMSGALIGPPLALELGKPMMMVRKNRARCHSWYLVEGVSNAKTYIVVDDFVASGDTVRAIVTNIKRFNKEAKCVGVVEVNKIRNKGKDYPILVPALV